MSSARRDASERKYSLFMRITFQFDRLLRFPEDLDIDTRIRCRAMVWWILISIPVGLLTVLPEHGMRHVPLYAGYESDILPFVGFGAVFLSIPILRFSQSLKVCGIWFGVWTVVALGAEPLLSGNPTDASLVLMTMSPVIFAFTNGWRTCAIYSACLLGMFPLTALIEYLRTDAWTPHSIAMTVACTCAAGAVGVATSFYSKLSEQQAAILTRRNRKIQQIALTDPLTGAGNRRAYAKSLRSWTQTAGPDDRIAMLMLDLDKFKPINDTFGHDIGDLILQNVCHRVSMLIGRDGRLFRLGGDEFAILILRPQSKKDVMEQAKALINIVTKPIATPSGDLCVEASVGVGWAKGPVAAQRDLYREADMALYAAKESCERLPVTYHPGLDAKYAREAAIEERLKLALQKSELTLVYQPQLDLETQDIVGFEALVRWEDRKLGTVWPGEFIPIAERTQLISKLDRYVLKHALAEASLWLGPVRRLSVNASARSIMTADFADFILEQVANSSLTYDQLEVEITETALIENWGTSKSTINALRNHGVRIVLDDFGVGYSSLSYLSQFPVQKIKFDRSFLVNSARAGNMAVMRCIIQLANTMGLDVIAEGVESAIHVSMLRQLRCNEVQGFYFARPVPGQDIRAFITGHESDQSLRAV